MKSFDKAVLFTGVLLFVLSSVSLAYEPQVHDFGGRTVTYATHHFDGRPDPDDVLYDYLREAEELFNVHVEFVRVTNPQILEYTIAAVLSGSQIDFVGLSERNYHSLAMQGALRSLNDVPEAYWQGIPEGYSGMEDFRQPRLVKGHIYGVPYMFPSYIHTTMMVWNTQMFAENNLPNIYDLVDSGEWTWDTLRRLAIQLTADTTGDGQIDQWGLANVPNAGPILLGALATNNAYLTKEVDGQVVFSLDEGGRASHILNLIQQLALTDDVFHPVGWNFDTFKNGQVGMYFTPLWAVGNFANEDFVHGIVPLPLGPDRSEYLYPNVSLGVLAIPVSSTEDTMALLDLHNSIFPLDVRLDDDVALRLSTVQDEIGYQHMLNGMFAWELTTPYAGLLNNPNMWTPTRQVVLGNRTASEVFASQGPVIQTALDDLLEQ